jgi:Flp pilus assembly protein TadD
MRGARHGLAALGAMMFLSATPAAAQAPVGAFTETPDAALARNLRSLAADPRSLVALMGAGRAALQLGDPQAALTFFARAEEAAPGAGRVKIWIASALAQMQQPHAALKFFREAMDLGVAEADVAKERGLAFDISGDPRSAQRDYRLALSRGPDEETTRRLALSLGITGERAAALTLLEPQLSAGNRAAERARAMILALTGDRAGAARAAGSAMPPAQAQAMSSFLERLAGLSTADRALAVHLGVFPGAGVSTPPTPGYAANDYARPPAVTDAGRPDPNLPSLERRPAVGAPTKRTAATQIASAAPPRQGVAVPAKETKKPPQGAAAVDGLDGTRSTQAEAKTAGPNDVAARKPATTVAEQGRNAAPATQPPASPSRLAELSAAIEQLPETVRPVPKAQPAKSPTQRPAQASAKPASSAATEARAKKPPAAPADPARVWVQVAGGSDKASLPREFARLKAKSPTLLGLRSAWTTPLNATNRLLVGPFAGSKEAQALVNQLKEDDIAAFAWESPAGQKIDKLAPK